MCNGIFIIVQTNMKHLLHKIKPSVRALDLGNLVRFWNFGL